MPWCLRFSAAAFWHVSLSWWCFFLKVGDGFFSTYLLLLSTFLVFIRFVCLIILIVVHSVVWILRFFQMLLTPSACLLWTDDVNPLDSKGNDSATSNNMKLVHWPLMGGPLLAVPNVTAHPSTASVPVTVLLYDGSLLCCFNWRLEG